MSSATAALSAFTVAALAGVVAVSFLMRNLFGTAIPGLLEFGETLIVLAVFLALAHGERVQSQIRMTLVTELLTPRTATVLRAFAMLVSLCVVLAFSAATSGAALDSFRSGEVRFGLLRFPLWPARVLIAVGFWLLSIQYLMKLLRYAVDLMQGTYFTYDGGDRTPLTGRVLLASGADRKGPE